MNDRDRRNLNPTAEAVVAMNLWGYTYSRQNGGSMDFWDSLSASEKMRCTDLVQRVREADRKHGINPATRGLEASNG